MVESKISCLNFLLLFFLLLLYPAQLFAEYSDVYIPPELQSWVKWVLERNPDYNCAVLKGGKQCLWAGKLELDIGKAGGSFYLIGESDKRDFVPLPGGDDVWPLAVEQGKRSADATWKVVVPASRD